jgi:hypothetical protein
MLMQCKRAADRKPNATAAKKVENLNEHRFLLRRK